MRKVRKGSLSRANGILVCQDNAISMPVNAMTGLSIREETLSAIISTAIIISLFLLFSFFEQLIEIFAIIGNYLPLHLMNNNFTFLTLFILLLLYFYYNTFMLTKMRYATEKEDLLYLFKNY